MRNLVKASGLSLKGMVRGAALLLVLLWTVSVQAQTYTPEQYYAAGNQCYQNHQYAQGITYLNAAIQLNPNYGPAYQLAGNCYYGMGDKASALNYYSKASQLQPDNVQLAQMVAALQGQTGMPSVQIQMNVAPGVMAAPQPIPTMSDSQVSQTSVQPAPAAEDSDEDDSRYYDKAKSRMIKIHGSQRKAYLYDTTQAHTLDHVFLCDQVTDVEFITGIDGKAWRINLTQQNGGSKDYDQDGHLLTSN